MLKDKKTYGSLMKRLNRICSECEGSGHCDRIGCEKLDIEAEKWEKGMKQRRKGGVIR